MSKGTKNDIALQPTGLQAFICPKCKQSFEIPYQQKGPWKCFNPVTRCTHCGKDVSKDFFLTMVTQNQKFKRSRTVGRDKPWGSFAGTEKGSGEVEVVEPTTFDEALSVLPPREQAFVLEYIKDFKGTRAAIAVGYSPKSARFIASENLTKPNIERALQLFYQERRKTAKKTVDDIEREMERVGFTNLTDVISFTRDGLTFAKESDDLSEDAKAALKKVKFTENMTGISVEVELHDKVGALKLLGLQKGMFKQKVDMNATVETYEQRRKRLGLDDMSPKEALEKYKKDNGLA